MKFYERTTRSWGIFGTAFSESIYDELLNEFDFETSGNCNIEPMDHADELLRRRNYNLTSINIFPTLISPDVRTSSHDHDGNQLDWIKRYTFIGENDSWPSLFSKHYGLRFSNVSTARIRSANEVDWFHSRAPKA